MMTSRGFLDPFGRPARWGFFFSAIVSIAPTFRGQTPRLSIDGRSRVAPAERLCTPTYNILPFWSTPLLTGVVTGIYWKCLVGVGPASARKKAAGVLGTPAAARPPKDLQRNDDSTRSQWCCPMRAAAAGLVA